MRAAVYERYGAPDVVRIEERGEPGLGAGEVLVRVEATVVGAAESAARSGRPGFARLYFGLR
jgi:NADPH:quinone reductase-like Zn-dependent oxidoreductase